MRMHPFPVATAFQKTELPCGLRIVTETIPSVRSVAVGLWIDVGSRDERDEEAGISHFIEHMVFKGTERRRTHQIAQRIEYVGGYLNAFTTKEHTCYYVRVLDEHLARALDTLIDLVFRPRFPDREIEKEKEVILEEMKMYEDTPDEYIFDLFEAVIYGEHPLGRPIVGRAETVRAFNRAMLVDFMMRQYTPFRMVLAAAGNVVHERVVTLAARLLRDVALPAGDQRVRLPVPAYQPAKRLEQRAVQQAHVVLGGRGYDMHHPWRAALMVLNTLLGGGMSSRLNQNIRERYGYCYNIYSFVNLHSDTGDWGVYMATDPGRVERVVALVERELDRLVREPVGQRVLTQAKNQVKGSLMLGQENMSNRMMRLGRQELYFGRYYSLDEALAEVDAVNAALVQEVAKALFAAPLFSRVVLLPK
ncbi:M16 family metallopeptidase [Rhodothermus bifroesti]|jgi:predicted Zn-dependent peptidase|uniref:Insulinase family protein n=1 Tax=Rhodothermus marinus TaxID=29549 RepID=A0A7V2B0Q1_RHOMR|nr:pitrilysin family protein [Rhodothermus bifroesti]GBD00572.1 putative zinc protease [bacterium HR18]